MGTKLKERREARRQFDRARRQAEREYLAANLERAVVQAPWGADWEHGTYRVVIYTGNKVAQHGTYRGIECPHGRVYRVPFKTREAARAWADEMNAHGLPDSEELWSERPNFKLWLPVGHEFHRSQRP